jgi:hypothetical protein
LENRGGTLTRRGSCPLARQLFDCSTQPVDLVGLQTPRALKLGQTLLRGADVTKQRVAVRLGR